MLVTASTTARATATRIISNSEQERRPLVQYAQTVRTVAHSNAMLKAVNSASPVSCGCQRHCSRRITPPRIVSVSGVSPALTSVVDSLSMESPPTELSRSCRTRPVAARSVRLTSVAAMSWTMTMPVVQASTPVVAVFAAFSAMDATSDSEHSKIRQPPCGPRSAIWNSTR